MNRYATHAITWATDPYVFELDAHPALFNVSWVYDYDTGWEAQAEFVETRVSLMIWRRDDMVAMSSEGAVAEVEREAAQHFADHWRDYLPEAAE